MRTKNLAISIMGTAILAGAVLAPGAATADWRWDRDYDHRGWGTYVERPRYHHRHQHRHSHRPRAGYEYRTTRSWGIRESPVVLLPSIPTVRLGRSDGLGLTYRPDW